MVFEAVVFVSAVFVALEYLKWLEVGVDEVIDVLFICFGIFVSNNSQFEYQQTYAKVI